MKRRTFLFQSAGTIGLIPMTSSFQAGEKTALTNAPVRSLLEKVKLAMLSMQRASWEHGVAMQAFLELGDDEMVYLMAQEAMLRQLGDGRLSVVYTDNGVTDPAASGEGVLYASNLYNDQKLKDAANRMLEYLLKKAPKSDNGIICHTLKGTQFWIDSMYMCPPFLAAAGQYSEAVKQIRGYRQALWNKDKKLFSHMWDDKKKKFINKNFWGVGNGWAAAGMARVIKSLPESMEAEKNELAGYVEDLLDGCLAQIRKDGLFHNYIDQKDTFVETNLSQMLAYTIFRGTKGKWLNKRYLNYALRMRKAAYSKVDQYGYVQGVCGAPTFQEPGRATEGQAFFLLMEASYNDYTKT